MGAVLLRLLSVAMALGPAGAGTAFAQRADTARVEALILQRTNDFRRDRGLSALAPDAKLLAAARYFAGYMARTERYGHEADGQEPADRATRHGYDYCLVAENIAYQFSSADFTTEDLASRNVEGWKGSAGHRKNMLSPHAVDTAVAVTRGAKSGRYYAVQMFGRPKSASIEFRITNSARDTVRYESGGKDFTLPPGSTRIHTQCTPHELVLMAGKRDKVTPRNGERLVVVREAGSLVIRAGP